MKTFWMEKGFSSAKWDTPRHFQHPNDPLQPGICIDERHGHLTLSFVRPTESMHAHLSADEAEALALQLKRFAAETRR